MAALFDVDGPRPLPSERTASLPIPGPGEEYLRPSQRVSGPTPDYMPYFNELYRIFAQDTDYTMGTIPIDWTEEAETDEMFHQLSTFMKIMEDRHGIDKSILYKIHRKVLDRIKDGRRVRKRPDDRPDDPPRPPPAMRDFAAVLSSLHDRIQALEASATLSAMSIGH